MESSELIDKIAAIPAFGGLDPDLVGRVAKAFVAVSRKEKALAGRTIFQVGDASVNDGVIVLTGEVSVEKEGSPEIIALAPELIGEMAQINPARQRTATVKAHTDITVLHFTWRDFANEAGTSTTEDEFKKISSALQDHAWKHFTQ